MDFVFLDYVFLNILELFDFELSLSFLYYLFFLFQNFSRFLLLTNHDIHMIKYKVS